MNDFVIKRGDRLPILQAEVSDDNGVVNLSNCQASFVYRNRYSGDPVIQSATVLTPTSGILQYSWTTGDVNIPGVYYAEWRVVFDNGSGKQLTFPNNGYITFEIVEAL